MEEYTIIDDIIDNFNYISKLYTDIAISVYNSELLHIIYIPIVIIYNIIIYL